MSPHQCRAARGNVTKPSCRSGGIEFFDGGRLRAPAASRIRRIDSCHEGRARGGWCSVHQWQAGGEDEKV